MNKYEELKKLVYGILYPEGIPLEFGCEVRHNYNWKLETTFIIEEESANSVFIETINDPIASCSIIENLWPDLTLQDIMRAIDTKIIEWSNFAVCTISEWYLNITFMGQNNPIKIHLSKKPKDRSDETFIKLINLLDE